MNSLIESVLIKSPFYTLTHLLIVVFAFLLGLLAYKRNPQNPNNKSFLVLNLGLVLWATITYLSNLTKIPIETQIILNRLTFSAAFILVIAFFNFCVVFPERKTNKPIVYRIVLMTCVAFAIYAGLTDWLQLEQITKETVTFKPSNQIIFQMFFYVYAVFCFWALVILFLKLKKLKGKEHTKVQYIFLAFLLFLMYVFSTNLIPAFFGLRFFIGHTALGAIIFIGLTSYAVIKHRLMDIRLVVIKSATYTVLAVIGALAYILVVFYLKNYYEKLINPDFVFIAASFAVAFGFKPLGTVLQKRSDKLFSKGRYDFNDLLKKLSQILSSQILLENLAKSLLTTLSKEMKITKSTFITNESYQHSEELVLPGKIISEIFKFAKPNKALVADELDDDSTKKDLMRKLGIEVLVFFSESQSQVAGFLALSEKRSGDAYTLQDLRLLEIIAPQITIALKNIEQQKKVIEQIVEERRRIDQDAHDHIYNRLGALAKKAEIAELHPDQAKGTLGLLKNGLRSAVSDLQMIVLDESNEEQEILNPVEEIRKICSDFEQQSSIKLNFNCVCPDLSIVDHKHLWHLQCILEECLNNVNKHSKATQVNVDIRKENSSIILQIKDNGIGIKLSNKKPKTKGALVGKGLNGMKERAKKINATLEFTSGKDKGTVVKLRVPVSI